MTDAKTSKAMSPKLRKVAERARRDPNARILSLAHLVDIDALGRAYARQRKDAAVGVDRMTKEQYGQDLGLGAGVPRGSPSVPKSSVNSTPE